MLVRGPQHITFSAVHAVHGPWSTTPWMTVNQ